MPEIRVALEAPDMAPERLDHATHLMQFNLKKVGGLAVHRVREAPPPDSLGTGALIAELLVVGSVGVGTASTLSSVLTSWLEFHSHRAITLRAGDVHLRADADTDGEEIESVLLRMTDASGA
ncbi:hypothetical protein GCM10027271_29520 [Saccharopolyspora gloriosae]|uniref:Uncharacterized protein n=1 Tax=Saccharopolyspora gloriosae TaxID=455344 RepID=A0A840NQ05_9PSEU|nr:hypothetical protein [Saccharopolyspora gloriosae]MBB5071212.1 hypothetical protein [Saccharopolyspora gloriosae]